MTCATKSELLMREPEEKVKEEASFFMCPSRHKMVYTSIAYDQQLTFNCKFCNKKYFGHTQRVYCKTCKFDCCEKCIGQLANANPPRCSQVPLSLFSIAETITSSDFFTPSTPSSSAMDA